MKKSKANARWEGILRDGRGEIKAGSGNLDSLYSFSTRFGDSAGTNPEELVGAAAAGCFSMALANELDKKGYLPKDINTDSIVTIDKVDGEFKITEIKLNTTADISEIDESEFLSIANSTALNCPVSKALSGTNISLEAKLK